MVHCPAANWKGSLVAVKTMLLPAAMSGKERREKMAIMETAISASLSHPNIGEWVCAQLQRASHADTAGSLVSFDDT